MFESFTSFAQSMTENLSLDSLQEEEEAKRKQKGDKPGGVKEEPLTSSKSSSFNAIAETFAQSSTTAKAKAKVEATTATATSGTTPAKKSSVSSSKSNEDFFADFISGVSGNTNSLASAPVSPSSSASSLNVNGTPQPVAGSAPITRTPPPAAIPSPVDVPAAVEKKTFPVVASSPSLPPPNPVEEARPEPESMEAMPPETKPVSDVAVRASSSVVPVSPAPTAPSSTPESVSAAVENSSVHNSAQQSQLQVELDQKSQQLVELQTKHSTMCEKFKDTVKKLSEIKETFKSKCRHYDEEIIQYRDSLNTKEFAHVSLQERYFLLEKQVGAKDRAAIESKAKVAELEELLADKQRLCDEKDTLVAQALAKCKAAETALLELQQSSNENSSQYDELLVSHRRMSAEHSSLQGELESLRTELQSKASDTTTSAHQIVTLNETISQLRSELEESANLATQFQEYKKRAQLALKQANSSVAENSNSLQTTFESTQRRLQMEIAQLNEDNQVLAREREQLRADGEAGREQQRLLERRVGALNQDLESSAATIRSLEQQLRQASLSASEGAQQMENQVEGSVPAGMGVESGDEDGDSGDVDASVCAPDSRAAGPTTPGAAASNFTIGGDSDEEEEEENERRQAHSTPAAAPVMPTASLQSPAPAMTTGVATPGTPIVNSSQLFMVYQLQQQLQSLRNDFINRGQQCDDLQRALDEAGVENVSVLCCSVSSCWYRGL
jgi:hypothetical protein